MSNNRSRVERHRAGLRAKGLRPVQIWVPDTRTPEFAEQARRQCLTINQADKRRHVTIRPITTIEAGQSLLRPALQPSPTLALA